MSSLTTRSTPWAPSTTTTQRRTKNLPSALLLPATELLPDTEPVSAFGCLPSHTLICLCETGRITERVKGVLFQAKEDTESLLAAGEPNGDLLRLLLSQSEWLSELERFPVCACWRLCPPPATP